MYIKEIEFYRFKKYRKATIRLKEGFSLLAGGNNSGKSTILHGLAVWQFCKLILEMERGVESLLSGYSGQGVGISDDEFIPVNLPSLKHLWTNLKTQKINEPDGYTLQIGIKWMNQSDVDLFLKLGLSLVNDRLFVKPIESSVSNRDDLINIIYIPPFAGISSKEERYTPAMIRKYIGEGVPGAILRNIILDLKKENDRLRNKEKTDNGKTRSSFLKRLRAEDPFERLKAYMERIFSYGIDVRDFNEQYHTYIRVLIYKGAINNGRLVRYPDYSPRDLMVEGSGFLQWLTVMTFSLSPLIDVIVLDEPDAHLHPTLQNEMIEDLMQITRNSNKQVIFATHSPELLGSSDYAQIINSNENNPGYLNTEGQKVKLLSGIGVDFHPRLRLLEKRKRILFVENKSDYEIIKIFSEIGKKTISENFVVWPWASRHAERKHIFLEIKKDIASLKAFSISDRDNESVDVVDSDLTDKGFGEIPDFVAKKWRRKHIESYLLKKEPIARATSKKSDEVQEYIRENFGVDISIHDKDQNADVLVNVDGKKIVDFGSISIASVMGKNKYDIAKSFRKEEIPDDMWIMIDEIMEFAKE
ncbi:MAG: AAA family ATPase [Candidatus Heimdallarchaeota archaeon]|nr:AAA family ATPase [Candidatus Heimdallarchaeota archaeon]